MNHHRLLRATLAAVLVSALPLTVNAVVSPAPTASPLSTTQATKLANLKSKGSTEIDRRISNLNAALTKLDASTKLAAADKTSLENQVKAEISGLTALKAKLIADTDLATARTDVQSIFADYRVYYLMLPKTRMVASADRFTSVEAALTTLEGKLQARVTAAKAAGKDITALQNLLDDMKAKIADAQAKSQSVVTPLLALQPTDYNQNHTVLLQYRASLKTAHDDLVASRDDAKTAIQDLKALGTSPTSSPSSSSSGQAHCTLSPNPGC